MCVCVCVCAVLTASNGALADVAVLALNALIDVKIDKLVGRRPSGREAFAINPKAMAHSAAKESQGLRQAGLLSPEEALLW